MEKETMVATVPQAEIVDEQQLSRDVTDIEFQAESLVIQTDEDYAFAGEFGKMLKKKAMQMLSQKQRKNSKRWFNQIHCRRKRQVRRLSLRESTTKKCVRKKAISNRCLFSQAQV